MISLILLYCLCLCTGITLGTFIPALNFEVICLFSIVLFLSFLIILFLKLKYSTKEKILLTIALCTICWVGYIISSKKKSELPTNDLKIYGTLIESLVWYPDVFEQTTDTSKKYTSFKFKLHNIYIQTETGNFCYAANDIVKCVTIQTNCQEFFIGDLLELDGSFSEFKKAANPNEFDAEQFYEKSGLHYQFKAKTIKKIGQNSKVWYVFLRYSEKIKNRMLEILYDDDTDSSKAIRKIICGVNENLSNFTKYKFESSGTAHIFSISGIHVSFVFLIGWFFLSILRISNKYKILILILLVNWFIVISGLRDPAIRAGIMCTVGLLAPFFQRKSNTINALALALFIYLLMYPYQLFGMGALLSFGSVLAVIFSIKIFPEPLIIKITAEDHDKKKKFHIIFLKKFCIYFYRMLFASFAVWLVTWPILSSFRASISFFGWLLNLSVIPLVTFVMFLSFLALIVSTINLMMAEKIYQLAKWIMNLNINLVNKVENDICGVYNTGCLTISTIFWYYLLLSLICIAICCNKLSKNKKKLLYGFALVAAVFFIISGRNSLYQPDPNDFRYVQLDVGMGDSIVLHDAGNTYVCDGGSSWKNISKGERILLPYLRAARVQKLELVICSHFDIDHCGGLFSLVNQFPVKRIAVPANSSENLQYKKLKELADAKNIIWEEWAAGQNYTFGQLNFKVLNPDFETNVPKNLKLDDGKQKITTGQKNEQSLVLFVSHPKINLLLTGDAPAKIEKKLLNRNVYEQVDLLKVAHHGSKTSSTVDFMNKINPKIAIIGVGNNIYKLPSEIVLSRFAEKNILTLRTDESGAVFCDATVTGIFVKTWNK